MLSVLMSVYEGESATFLRQSLESLAAQTRPADEIVLVEDGPLGSELQEVIRQYASCLPIEVMPLPHHAGLGVALRLGVERCRFSVIARMDADDVCTHDRFEQQLGYLLTHPEIDVLGSSILEFDADASQCLSERRPPKTHEAIVAYAKMRNPMNHMTVMFRKEKVLAAGNYRSCPGFEDYDLWARMLISGARFQNLEECLVRVRCGNGMQLRRGGVGYLQRELSLFWSFYESGFLNISDFVRNVLVRLPMRLVPASVRAGVYRRFLRSNVHVTSHPWETESLRNSLVP